MQVAQVVDVVSVARRCAQKRAFMSTSSQHGSQEKVLKNATAKDKNEMSKSRTTENSEDVALLDVLAAFEQ